MIYALRDPIGANLDRIQVIKGWLDAKGRTHEKVYDVANLVRAVADRSAAVIARTAAPSGAASATPGLATRVAA